MYNELVKKPTLASLRQAIRITQDELKRHEPFFHPTNALAGWCQENQSVAKQFGGDVYDTDTPSSHGRNHTVGVVSTRGWRGGYVVDITKEKGIIGTVRDTDNEASVINDLTQSTSIGGWKRRK